MNMIHVYATVDILNLFEFGSRSRKCHLVHSFLHSHHSSIDIVLENVKQQNTFIENYKKVITRFIIFANIILSMEILWLLLPSQNGLYHSHESKIERGK